MDAKNSEFVLLISVPTAARMLGVWPERLRRAIDAGQVPSVVVGKRQMVPRRAVEKLALVDSDGWPLNEKTAGLRPAASLKVKERNDN